MAQVSSHTLNAVDGTHAGGIPVVLSRLEADGTRRTLFTAKTDRGGRLNQSVELSASDCKATFELLFSTGTYWARLGLPRERPQLVEEIVIRFRMPDCEGRYHIPLILSPNGTSVWWSS